MKKILKIERQVILSGLRELMFDRYSGDNKKDLRPEQKMYLNEKMELIFPAANILSFLCAENTKSAAKFFYDKREYKDIAQAILSHVVIEPVEIPITRDGKTPIKFTGFKNGEIEIHKSVARLKGGIPNPKERPMLRLPWQIQFKLTLYENKWIDEEALRNLFEQGGMLIGLGTFRGVFGKFAVSYWE